MDRLRNISPEALPADITEDNLVDFDENFLNIEPELSNDGIINELLGKVAKDIIDEELEEELNLPRVGDVKEALEIIKRCMLFSDKRGQIQRSVNVMLIASLKKNL